MMWAKSGIPSCTAPKAGSHHDLRPHVIAKKGALPRGCMQHEHKEMHSHSASMGLTGNTFHSCTREQLRTAGKPALPLASYGVMLRSYHTSACEVMQAVLPTYTYMLIPGRVCARPPPPNLNTTLHFHLAPKRGLNHDPPSCLVGRLELATV